MSMANTVVEPVPPEAHFQVCQLHDQKGLATCSAYLKRGNFKCSKQATMREPHMLATCKLHRGQLKPASRCQVQLSCGDKCAKICEWRLHAVQRCVAHTDAPTPSYFLKIPLELRARVYAYLLPEKTCQEPRTLLQARAEGASSQYQPSKQVFMDICRVNRQIHTEVTTLLYGSSMFTIWLTASGLHMGMATPNSAQSSVRNPVYVTYPSRQGSHALNDYQMKLILLEQTNAKVLAAHRFNNVFTGGTPSQQAAPMMRMQQLRAQANPALAESSSRSSESHRLMRRLQPRVSDFGTRREPSLATSISTLTAQPQGHADAPSSEWPVWDAQLSTKYFNMIQSFRINIVCPFYACSHVKTRLSTSHGLGVPKSQSVQIDASTYEYIDHLHKLVSRLEIASPRIYRLEVCIQFEHEPDEIQDLPMLDLLLRPFLRLCNIPCATAMIITPSYLARVRNSPNVYPPPRDGTELFTSYLQEWSRTLNKPTPAVIPSNSFRAYWQLENLTKTASRYNQGTQSMVLPVEIQSGFKQFACLRQHAQVAREEEDLETLRTIGDIVCKVWNQYLEWELGFQAEVETKMKGLWGLLDEC